MRLAERLRAAGTRTGPLLAGASSLQWLSTLVRGRRRSDYDGWRFEQGPMRSPRSRARSGSSTASCRARGRVSCWPIVLSPFASAADTLDGVLAGVALLNVLVLGPVALVSAYWIAARSAGRLLGAWTVALWVAGAVARCSLFALDPYDPTSAIACCRSPSG